MKKLLMTSVMAVLFSPVVGFAAPPLQAPSKAVQAPVQAPTQAPVQAPNKTAQAAQPTAGYRTYSYQPGMTPNYNYNSRLNNGRPAFFSGHQPADYKVRGEYWAR